MGHAASTEEAQEKRRLEREEEELSRMALRDMDASQAVAWLSKQRLPESFDVETVSAALLRRGMTGAQLADASAVDLRETVMPLGWRKAIVRAVDAKLRHEALPPVPVLPRGFSFRKSSRKLKPLEPSPPRRNSLPPPMHPPKGRWNFSFRKEKGKALVSASERPRALTTVSKIKKKTTPSPQSRRRAASSP